MFALPALAPKPTNVPNDVIDYDRRGCAEVLLYAWQCYDRDCRPEEIRSALSETASRNPGFAGTCLAGFDSLATYYKGFATGDACEWLDAALHGRSREGVLVELKPTCILLRVPESTYQLLEKDGEGFTSVSRRLPPELIGRVVVLPWPKRTDEFTTYKHEVVHTLQNRTASPAVNNAKPVKLNGITHRSQGIATISSFCADARLLAFKEITAYEGTEYSARSLAPYGIGRAVTDLETIRRDLSLNTVLTLEDKRELFAQAQLELHYVIHYAIAARSTFLDRIKKWGALNALVDALVSYEIDVDWRLHRQNVDELESRVSEALVEAKVEESLWCSDNWKEIINEIRFCPHPQLLFLLVETVERSSNTYVTEEALKGLMNTLKLDPFGLPDNLFKRLFARVESFASDVSARDHGLVAKSQSFLDLERLGLLRGSPFHSSDRTPEGEICEALKSASPSQAIVTLFVERYPDRDPIWKTLPIGTILEVMRKLPENEAIDVYLAVAQNSSEGFDIRIAVSSLARLIESKTMPETFLERIQILLPFLPEGNTDELQIAFDPKDLAAYQQNRQTIQEYVNCAVP